MNTDPETLIQEALTGDRSPTDPALRRALAADPQLRRRFEELQQLTIRLDEEGMLQRDALETRTRARPTRQWPWLVLAAAALVAGATLWVARRPAPPQLSERQTLGTVWRLSPDGVTPPPLTTFQWSDPDGALPMAASYFVVLLDAAGRPIDSIETEHESRWQPTEQHLRSIPSRFRWRVEARIGADVVRASAEVSVELH